MVEAEIINHQLLDFWTCRRASVYFAAMRRVIRLGLISAAIVLTAGCARVQRTISIDSDPPGALVYMNDQEIGRTPVTRDFLWYGKYDVELRKEGYETRKTSAKVIAPWWQWPPFDLMADLVPFRLKDKRNFSYVLQPEPPPPTTDEMLGRAEQLRLQLQSSQYTKNPATRPVTQPTTQSTTQPATTQSTQPSTTQSTQPATTRTAG